MSKEIKIIPDWYEKFWDAMERLYPRAVYIPEICDAYEYLAENVIQPLLEGQSGVSWDEFDKLNKAFQELSVKYDNNKWVTDKPVFTKDCILLVADWWNDHWETKAFDIIYVLGEDDDGEPAWYWSVLSDGDEWGDIEDIYGQLYQVIEFPPFKSGTTPTGANTVSEG